MSPAGDSIFAATRGLSISQNVAVSNSEADYSLVLAGSAKTTLVLTSSLQGAEISGRAPFQDSSFSAGGVTISGLNAARGALTYESLGPAQTIQIAGAKEFANSENTLTGKTWNPCEGTATVVGEPNGIRLSSDQNGVFVGGIAGVEITGLSGLRQGLPNGNILVTNVLSKAIDSTPAAATPFGATELTFHNISVGIITRPDAWVRTLSPPPADDRTPPTTQVGQQER